MSEQSTGGGKPFERKVTLARSIIAYERGWTAFAPVLTIIAAFLAFAWFGGFSMLPPLARAAVTIGFAAVLAMTLWRLRGLAMPAEAEAVARLDADSGVAHRPALTQRDALSLGKSDPAAEALWALHRKRSEDALAKLSLPRLKPEIARRDPVALRVGALVAAFAALFAAGHEWRPRLVAAFDWTTPAPPAAPPRLDVWINPPGYTGRPPIFLARSERPRAAAETANGEPQQQPAQFLKPEASAPAGSVIIIRVAPADAVAVEAAGGLSKIEPEAKKIAVKAGEAPPQPVATTAPAGPFEARYRVDGDGSLIVRQGTSDIGSFKLTVIPDQPPTITFVEAKRQERGEGLILRYRAADDYGLAKVSGLLARLPDAAARARARSCRPRMWRWPPRTRRAARRLILKARSTCRTIPGRASRLSSHWRPPMTQARTP